MPQTVRLVQRQDDRCCGEFDGLWLAFASAVVTVLVHNAAALLHNCPAAFCCALVYGSTAMI